MEKQHIFDIAVKNVIKIDSDTPIRTAIDVITNSKIRNLVVHDKARESYMVLSVGDIVSITTGGVDISKPVSLLKLRPLPTCGKHTSALEAVMLFGDDNAIVGVVDEEGLLVGIATYSNVLNALYGYEDDSFSQPIKSLLAKDGIVVAKIGDRLTDYLNALNSTTSDCLIVLKENLPQGIITKRDIVKMLAKNISLDQNIEALMSYPLMTVDSEISINNALLYMQDNKLKRVIVVDKYGKLEGVITQKDLLDAIYTRLTQKGFFNLNKINALLQEQVNLKTMELQQLNKELELRVENATRELRESERRIAEMKRNEALFELLKNIAHHWRQPLNLISLLAYESEIELVGREDMSNIVSNMRSISSEVKSLSVTIDKMTAIYKDGKSKETDTVIDIEKTAECVIELFVGKNNIEIKRSYNIEECYFTIKDSLIRFILEELVSNSVRVATKNEKKILLLHFSLIHEGNEVVIRIQDDAGGIEKQNIDFLFDPYFTTEFKSRDKGLGLYMVKNIVEKSLGGKIAAEAISGGAKFEIRLPLFNKERI